MTRIFWLHIKKSAGQSTRRALQPHYVLVDRSKEPKNFPQADESEWNDILNNYRIPLGEYQFRRCLFAKKYLYHENFNEMFKFAFSRNPYDRCISQFFYLWRKNKNRKRKLYPFLSLLSLNIQGAKIKHDIDYDFDLFLEAIAACRESSSNYTPMGIRFQTHTAAMFDDITDESGAVLLDKIWRLDNFDEGISFVHKLIKPEFEYKVMPEINVSKNRTEFTLTAKHKKKVEKLFGKDIDIYESC